MTLTLGIFNQSREIRVREPFGIVVTGVAKFLCHRLGATGNPFLSWPIGEDR